MKKLRSSKVDMSPGAIDRRLKKLAQLRRFGKSLQQGRWIGKRDLPERPHRAKSAPEADSSK